MVYMLLADGFEEIEAVYPIDVLRRCGVEVKTVGIAEESNPGMTVTGSNKITIKTDISVSDVKQDNISMLILPGGPGRVNLKQDSRAMALIRHCCESGIPIAAICGAPEILAELGFLAGKRATCYPGLEKNMPGMAFVDSPVVIDGNLITAQGAGSSEKFAFAIAEFLCGKEKSDEIYNRMICGK